MITFDDDDDDKDDGDDKDDNSFAHRYQFGLSLICAGKYPRALLVLDECAKMQPKNYQVTNSTVLQIILF